MCLRPLKRVHPDSVPFKRVAIRTKIGVIPEIVVGEYHVIATIGRKFCRAANNDTARALTATSSICSIPTIPFWLYQMLLLYT